MELLNIVEDILGNDTDFKTPLFQDYPPFILNFASASCVLFFILGVPGNLFTIIALSRCKKVRNATATFIINLSVSDLMFACFNLPLATSTFWYRRWIYGNLLCRLFPLMRYGLLGVSLFTILAITINRYIMISHPDIYPKLYRVKYIWIMVGFTWVLSFGLLVPTWFGLWGHFGLDAVIGSCSIIPDDEGRSPKQFLFIGAFGVPCISIVVCYARIFFIVRNTARRTHLNTGNNAGVPSAAVTVRGGSTKSVKITNKSKPTDTPADDSALGSSSGTQSTTERSSSVLTESGISEPSSKQVVITTTPNRLSLPSACNCHVRMSAEVPSSSSGMEGSHDDDELETSTSATVPITCKHTKEGRTGNVNRERLPSAVNTTLNHVVCAFRRNSPISFNPRRRSGMPGAGKMSTKDRKLLQMILVIFAAFVGCYLPITMDKIVPSLKDNYEFHIGGYILIYLTTCINPIIYVVMSSEYRQAYKNLFMCIPTGQANSRTRNT